MALRFTEADLNVYLNNEGRDDNQHFQTYKFYFAMRMRFTDYGDSVVYIGDLLNIHGDPLDRIFEQGFRACCQIVNLQHFNRNVISQDDFVQFTLKHMDFVDYVFSSRKVKYSDLSFETLVGGVINWLNNLAQSNRLMNFDNDWAINLQVSRMTEVPRGFGKDDPIVELRVNKEDYSTFCPQTVINVNVSRLSLMTDASMDEDEHEREIVWSCF